MDFVNTTNGPRASANSLGQVVFPYEQIILASLTGFLIILLSFRLIPSSSVTIKDDTGRAIKTIQSDSRVAKFIDRFVLDASKPSKFVTFELVAYQLYGEPFNDELYKELLEINSLHEVVLHDVILNNGLTTKVGSWLNRAAARRMTEYNMVWKAYNMKIINRARKTNCSCPVERMFRGVEHGELKLTEFLHTLDEVLFANVEVSAAVLNTLLTNLAANQDFQSRLRDEVTSWAAEESGNLETFLSKQDTLLNFAVMESMRLSPAFSFSLPECTSTDKNIGGYKVPGNTAVVIDARRLNTDPDSWGTDSGEFRPERFRQVPLSRCRYSYMRFGTGGASGRCLGKNVADIVFKLTVMEVLKRFSLCRPHALAVNDVEFAALED
ncbi:hypothetical protein INS49_014804 [Diaporthe citri]|uniref:uncharacterized protein n=1 Tax=Diaporthe citri TaxID=83186 RepID=UPI001C819A3E|nr:uncharacterized protein INS49_014804 [Diaporthe citri]KAG6356929.1 hypothetical protein INS49_014804 [Diaporthe citri]